MNLISVIEEIERQIGSLDLEYKKRLKTLEITLEACKDLNTACYACSGTGTHPCDGYSSDFTLCDICDGTGEYNEVI